MQNSRPILLVEDDNIDAMTVRRSLEDLNIANQLVRTTNGEEALEYLKDESGKEPCIILLDLNMPKMNGIEFLEVVRASSDLKRIPVIVLTTSRQEQDIADSFKHGVAGYMVKPVDYEEFVETVRTINKYWDLSELVESK